MEDGHGLIARKSQSAKPVIHDRNLRKAILGVGF